MNTLNPIGTTPRANNLTETAGRALGTVGELLRRLITRQARRRRRLATYRELAGLDDRALQDIGLSRSDITYVADALSATATPQVWRPQQPAPAPRRVESCCA